MPNYQQNYEKLALLYDFLMEGIDYQAWVSYVSEIVDKFGGGIRRVADLACGTGGSTFPWAEGCYQVCGVDLSEEMLKIARYKMHQRGLEFPFLEQNLCTLQLPEPVDLAVCFQDGLNYITEPGDLRQACQAVYRNLTAGGFFIFDLNYVPRVVRDNQEPSVVEDQRFSLNWSTRLLEGKHLWEIEVHGRLRDGSGEELHECHRERIYELEDVWSLLSSIGFTVQTTYQSFTFEQPHALTPRVVCVAQKI